MASTKAERRRRREEHRNRIKAEAEAFRAVCSIVVTRIGEVETGFPYDYRFRSVTFGIDGDEPAECVVTSTSAGSDGSLWSDGDGDRATALAARHGISVEVLEAALDDVLEPFGVELRVVEQFDREPFDSQRANRNGIA